MTIHYLEFLLFELLGVLDFVLEIFDLLAAFSLRNSGGLDGLLLLSNFILQFLRLLRKLVMVCLSHALLNLLQFTGLEREEAKHCKDCVLSF